MATLTGKHAAPEHRASNQFTLFSLQASKQVCPLAWRRVCLTAKQISQTLKIDALPDGQSTSSWRKTVIRFSKQWTESDHASPLFPRPPTQTLSSHDKWSPWYFPNAAAVSLTLKSQQFNCNVCETSIPAKNRPVGHLWYLLTTILSVKAVAPSDVTL